MVMLSKSEVGNWVITKPRGPLVTGIGLQTPREGKGQGDRGLKADFILDTRTVLGLTSL